MKTFKQLLEEVPPLITNAHGGDRHIQYHETRFGHKYRLIWSKPTMSDKMDLSVSISARKPPTDEVHLNAMRKNAHNQIIKMVDATKAASLAIIPHSQQPFPLHKGLTNKLLDAHPHLERHDTPVDDHDNKIVTLGPLHKQVSEALDRQLQTILDKAPLSKRTNLINYRLHKKYGPGKVSHGSSRAVIHDSEPHKIVLDGKKTAIPAVYKIAKHNPQIDKHIRQHGSSMGEFQNMVEGRTSLDKHRILQKQKDGSYKTNPHGFLLPVFHKDPLGHYTHTAEIEPLHDDLDSSHASFRRLTKTASHPEGISHDDFYGAIDPRYRIREAGNYRLMKKVYGSNSPATIEQKKRVDLADHPLVKAVREFSHEHGIDSGDFALSNMGIFRHPHTKKEHLVISDAGFSKGVSRYYKKTWMTPVTNNGN